MAGDPIRIVLSYRRDDSSGHAGHLYADLVERFGPDQVFIDIDAIEPGLDFTEVITSAIDSADVLIAVMGKRWLTATDKQGRRKVDLDDDFVRLEIESAIEQKLRILPVLVQGAEMPSSDDLPPSMATFTRRHAFEISDKRWRDDVGELIELLEGIAAAKAQKTGLRGARPAGAEYDREVWAAQEAAAEQARRERETQLVQTQPVPIGAPGPPVGFTPGYSPPPSPRPAPAVSKGWLIGAGVAAVVLLLAVVGLVAAVSGGNGESGGGGNGSVPDTSVDGGPLVTTVDVRSDVPWNDTGIDLTEGQTVEFVASGTIETAEGDSSRDSEPDGKDGEEYGNNVIPGVKHGALIAMIGQDEPFEIGAYFVGGVVDGDGRLYLGVNDKGVENNAGSYSVTITVY